MRRLITLLPALPREQPTRFELVLSPGSVKALGFTLPQALLGRAGEAIR